MIDDKVVKNIEIKSPVAKVWDLITNPEMMKLWVVETPIEIESDWKVGSSIVIGGNIHGFNYKNKGTILQLEPEKVFEYNFWSEISRVPDIPENYSKIKFELTPNDENTILEVTHSDFLDDIAYKHGKFYWNTTVHIIKQLAEKNT